MCEPSELDLINRGGLSGTGESAEEGDAVSSVLLFGVVVEAVELFVS